MCNIAVRIESYTKLWNKNICKDWPLKQIKKNNVILDQMMGKKHFTLSILKVRMTMAHTS